MKWILLTTKSNENWLNQYVEQCQKKISQHLDFELVQVNTKSFSRSSQGKKKQTDADLLLERIHEGDWVVVFDERGKLLNSVELSQKVNNWLCSSAKRVVLVIGGPFGLSSELLARANYKISLSALTMNHHIALAVSMEQLYRSMAILKNLPYHNE